VLAESACPQVVGSAGANGADLDPLGSAEGASRGSTCQGWLGYSAGARLASLLSVSSRILPTVSAPNLGGRDRRCDLGMPSVL
jgi:hypothetical protein